MLYSLLFIALTMLLPPQQESWKAPFPAHTIAGNLHYVGTDRRGFRAVVPQAEDAYARYLGGCARVAVRDAGKYEAGSFVDPDGYKRAIDRFEKLYLEQLAEERGQR